MQFNLYTNKGKVSQCLNNEDSLREKEKPVPEECLHSVWHCSDAHALRSTLRADTRINRILAERESMLEVIAPCSCDSGLHTHSLLPRVNSWRPLFAEKLSSGLKLTVFSPVSRKKVSHPSLFRKRLLHPEPLGSHNGRQCWF